MAADVPYARVRFGDADLICLRTDKRELKIVLPDALLPKLVSWYHEATAHIEGTSRLENTISRHFYHPRLRQEIRDQLRHCKTCQQIKHASTAHGQLAPRTVIIEPWSEVHIDTIGPWRIKINKTLLLFQAHTCIDLVLNLLKIKCILNKQSLSTWHAFMNHWLASCLWPQQCIHDNGPKDSHCGSGLHLANNRKLHINTALMS